MSQNDSDDKKEPTDSKDLKDPWEKAGDFFKKAVDVAAEAAVNAKKEYDKSAIKEKVEEGAGKAKAFLDEKGVIPKTNQRIDELEEKLEDALKRIKALEDKE